MPQKRKKPSLAEEIKALRGRLRLLFSECGREPDEKLIERTVGDSIEELLPLYCSKEIARIFDLGSVPSEDEDED